MSAPMSQRYWDRTDYIDRETGEVLGSVKWIDGAWRASVGKAYVGMPSLFIDAARKAVEERVAEVTK